MTEPAKPSASVASIIVNVGPARQPEGRHASAGHP